MAAFAGDTVTDREVSSPHVVLRISDGPDGWGNPKFAGHT